MSSNVGAQTKHHAAKTLFAVCLPIFIVIVNTGAVNVALPSIGQELGASTSELSWIVTAYIVVCAATITAAGQLGDIIGRRKVMLAGFVLFGISSVVIALGDSVVEAIGGRALQGLSAAMIVPGTLSLLNVAIEPERRTWAIGIWSGIVGLGFAIGPILGGVITQTLGWQWLWWLNLPVVVVSFVLVRAWLTESRDPAAPKIDFFGVALFSVSIFLLILAIVEGPGWGFESPETIGSFAGAALLAAVFVVWEQRVEAPLMHLSHFRKLAFVEANVGTLLISAALFGGSYYINLYLQNPLGFDLSAVMAGAAIAPMALAFFLCSLRTGRIAERHGSKLPILLGFALSAIGFTVMVLIGGDTDYAVLGPALVLIGVGVGLATGPTSAVGISAVSDDKAGEASGVINMFRYLGGGLGIAIAGVLFVGGATDSFNDRIGSSGASAGQERAIDAAIAGSKTALTAEARALPPVQQHQLATEARASVEDGFVQATWLFVVVSLVGLGSGAALLRRFKVPQKHHEHHVASAPAAQSHSVPHSHA